MNIHSLYQRIRKARLWWLPRPNKLLYEHIPKCGGTSVSNFLRSQYHTNRTFWLDGSNPVQSINEFKAMPEAQRHAYDLIIGHRAFELRDFCHPEMSKATIFREPIDRIISHYYFVRRKTDHYLHEQVTKQNMSLLDYATTGVSTELRNNYVARFLSISAEEAEKEPEVSVNQAFAFIQRTFSCVGILDRLDEAATAIAQQVSVPDAWQPTYLNQTSNRPQLDSVDDTTLQAIREVNGLDVALFDKIRAIAL
ncbi:MAG: sulfotransferase family 2 domain-containing protein [Chloroflexota bacterium]